jgi:hypothetical protein
MAVDEFGIGVVKDAFKEIRPGTDADKRTTKTCAGWLTKASRVKVTLFWWEKD